LFNDAFLNKTIHAKTFESCHLKYYGFGVAIFNDLTPHYPTLHLFGLGGVAILNALTPHRPTLHLLGLGPTGKSNFNFSF
jgi:hypothetical protein